MVLQTMIFAATVGDYPSLELDSNGYAHISYYDSLNEDLKYAYHPSEFVYFYKFLPLVFDTDK